ncbi:Transcription initiation factor TFIID subunit 1 [Trichinella murrelli]|uniref:Transcription initiation factor TFIID subunit 1 n=1 Tax=Trichinella murrelli TaxID=144512 RepID=A0A0V0TV17_9BILA|nr:Transcription initiation factor TFIID subunit 1 [Trichinella murrelli]
MVSKLTFPFLPDFHCKVETEMDTDFGEKILTSALFGNLNEDGSSDESFFDSETLSQLGNLSSVLNLSGLVTADDMEEVSLPPVKLVFSDSEDFSTTDELASDGTLEDLSKPTCSKFWKQPLQENDEETAEGLIDSEKESDDEAPLANMLPEEYRDYDVSTLFPEFRKNQVLRFSRLFGPGKPSSMPMIWRSARNWRRPESGVDSDSLDFNGLETAVDHKWKPNLIQTAILTQAQDQIENGDHLRMLSSPLEDEFEADDEIALHKLPKSSKPVINEKPLLPEPKKVAPWRYGVAMKWYDKLNIPPSGEGYGRKKDEELEEEQTEEKQVNSNIRLSNIGPIGPCCMYESGEGKHCRPLTVEEIRFKEMEAKRRLAKNSDDEFEFKCDSLFPYHVLEWEKSVVLSDEQAKNEFLKLIKAKRFPKCGWIANSKYGWACLLRDSVNLPPETSDEYLERLNTVDSLYDFFGFPPCDIDFKDWEENVILNLSDVHRIPGPNLVEITPTECLSLFGVPEDVPKEGTTIQTSTEAADFENKLTERREHQATKKSQLILHRVVQRKNEEEEESMSQMQEKDPLNLSNDEYYLPKGALSLNAFVCLGIQHSIPSQNLMQPYFPTHFSLIKLRQFHRPQLRRFPKTAHQAPILQNVISLEKHVEQKKIEREQERLASGGGEMFFMRKPADLTGKDGELILLEYCEEHPPLLSQPGMGSKIKNYFKRLPGKDDQEPQFEYGETSYSHSTPFLGTLAPGETLQAIENNLFRAPIFRHRVPSTDFLIMRTRSGLYIRKVEALFCVGQELPLIEVPSPNSKRACNFVRDFLLAFIYRLFWNSKEDPRRLRMDDLRRAFPHHAESSIRKRLRICSDFRRLGSGIDSNFWVLKQDFRLPNTDELWSMITPETCCAYYSMLAAEQRLKDAGYGEKYFFTPEEDEDDDDQVKIADEIKCAPWNTTRAYISAVNGKCLLDITGVADPTGCGEGFSFVKLSSKPQKEEVPPPVKKNVTGTDADLRKLSLKDAKQLLREFGVQEEEVELDILLCPTINMLSRWEIIDVIRTLSTQQAKSGGTGKTHCDFGVGITKFARGNMRYSVAEVQERYKQDCQRIFQLQNEVLSCLETVTTDDEQSDGNDSDIEEMGKNIENMLTVKKTGPLDSEEHERLELQKLMASESSDQVETVEDKPVQQQVDEWAGKRLKIIRYYRDGDDNEHVGVEYVTKPQLIEAYMKIRSTKDESFIKHFAQMDEQFREERRRQKRRLQDQLRRIRRKEIKAQLGMMTQRPKPEKPTKPPPPPKPSLLKMRCSACGEKGHMKTNKNCPLYNRSERVQQSSSNQNNQNTATTSVPSSSSSSNIKTASVVASSFSSVVTVASTVASTAPSSASATSNATELETAPVVPIDETVEHDLSMKSETTTGDSSSAVETNPEAGSNIETSENRCIHLEGMKLKLSWAVLEQAETATSKKNRSSKTATALGSGSDMEYEISESDDDSVEGKRSVYSFEASDDDENDRAGDDDEDEEWQTVDGRLIVNPKYLEPPKQGIYRRRTDPRVTMSVVLENILNEIKLLPEAEPFLVPVRKRSVPDYHKVVSRPMSIQTIRMNITKNQYVTREEFLKDIRQILDNSRLYNGDQSEITISAQHIFTVASRLVAEKESRLMKLEKEINPLLDDNDQVAFSFIIGNIIDACKKIPKSFAFHSPVDVRKVKSYYDKVKDPMDLGTMEMKAKRHQYHSLIDFFDDMHKIRNNSILFNGPTSPFTLKASEIVSLARKLVIENKAQLIELEENLHKVREQALEVAKMKGQTTADGENFRTHPENMKLLEEELSKSSSNNNEIVFENAVPVEMYDRTIGGKVFSMLDELYDDTTEETIERPSDETFGVEDSTDDLVDDVNFENIPVEESTENYCTKKDEMEIISSSSSSGTDLSVGDGPLASPNDLLMDLAMSSDSEDEPSTKRSRTLSEN